MKDWRSQTEDGKAHCARVNTRWGQACSHIQPRIWVNTGLITVLAADNSMTEELRAMIMRRQLCNISPWLSPLTNRLSAIFAQTQSSNKSPSMQHINSSNANSDPGMPIFQVRRHDKLPLVNGALSRVHILDDRSLRLAISAHIFESCDQSKVATGLLYQEGWIYIFYINAKILRVAGYISFLWLMKFILQFYELVLSMKQEMSFMLWGLSRTHIDGALEGSAPLYTLDRGLNTCKKSWCVWLNLFLTFGGMRQSGSSLMSLLHGRQWVNLPNWPFGGCIHGYPCFIILVFINKLSFVL